MAEIAKNYHNYLKGKKELINELDILSDTDGLNFKNEKINGLFNYYSSNFNNNSSFSSIELNIESIDKILSYSDDDDNNKKDKDNNSKYRKSIKNTNVKNATSNNKSNTQFNKNKINTSKNVDSLLSANFNKIFIQNNIINNGYVNVKFKDNGFDIKNFMCFRVNNFNNFKSCYYCNFTNYEERYKIIIDRRKKIFNNVLEINVNDNDYLNYFNKIKLLIRKKILIQNYLILD